jgi:hypothetical protein
LAAEETPGRTRQTGDDDDVDEIDFEMKKVSFQLFSSIEAIRTALEMRHVLTTLGSD